MKKWPIIIPSLAVISTTPIISLTSCSEIEQYIVSEEEFEKAIKMTGVTYLQVLDECTPNKSTKHSNEEIDHGCIKTSSSVCYCLCDAVGCFYEYYELKVNNKYTKFFRDSKEAKEWQTIEDADGKEFCTAETFGWALYSEYEEKVELGAVAWFNPDEKCYSMEWTSENNASCYNKYYFVNKRLIKILSSDGTSLTTYDFTYNEETPTIPEKPTSLEADPMEEWKVA